MEFLLGFIGCGNMGGALARAAAKSVGGEKIAVCDYDLSKAQALAKDTGACVLSAAEIAELCPFVVLGVKPQNMQETLAPLAPILRARESVTLISMAAGMRSTKLQDFCGAPLPVIRIMPNTPVLLGEGMILYALNGASEEAEKTFLESFAKAGKIDKIDEKDMDAASALSGCGPAYVYAFAQALTEGTKALGVDGDKAAVYAAQTILGAAQMLAEFKDAAALKKAVCSPGGTTLAGLKAMEENGFSSSVKEGVNAAYERALELNH